VELLFAPGWSRVLVNDMLFYLRGAAVGNQKEKNPASTAGGVLVFGYLKA
jgi:hypothetical protein